MTHYHNRRGVSFTEIAFAMLILGLALLPVFGLITGGLARTDISTGITAAVQLGSAVMNKLLSDSLPFASIPVVAGAVYRNAAGSVAGNATLDPVFNDPGWAISGTARTLTKDGIDYSVFLWTGRFTRDTDLSFRYLKSPDIRYTDYPGNSQYYMPQLRLQSSDYGFSPYNGANTHNVGAQWASTVETKNQGEVSPTASSTPHDANQSLLKLVLQVVWSPHATRARGIGEANKSFWLISFRANLGGM
jgi:hypothetical protein